MSQIEPRPFFDSTLPDFDFDAPGDVIGSLHAGRVKADAIRKKGGELPFIISRAVNKVKTEIYFVTKQKQKLINF